MTGVAPNGLFPASPRWRSILPTARDRESGGSVTRFKSRPPHADRNQAALSPNHPALIEGTTIFQRSISPLAKSKRVLVGGHNNPKLGRRVSKGAWRGGWIYQLTLVERETCPHSCGQWDTCFGNAMPLARRHAYTPELVLRIDAELAALEAEHRFNGGLVIRLHNLGDFPDLGYVGAWARWMVAYPYLRVFGYTAHPIDSPIGKMVAWLGRQHPDRWRIRFSVPPGTRRRQMQATTIWRQVNRAVIREGLVCPAQQFDPSDPNPDPAQRKHRTAACATCALCWSPAAADQRIVFIGHGMTRLHTTPDGTVRGPGRKLKLTIEQRAELRVRRQAGETLKVLAHAYGISVPSVAKIGGKKPRK